MTFLLLARQVKQGISPNNVELFGQSIKFYIPRKRLPLLEVSWQDHKQQEAAAREWINKQPMLDQPTSEPVFLTRHGVHVVMFVIEQDWKHPAGRPSDWVSAWTSCGWGRGFEPGLIAARNWFAER